MSSLDTLPIPRVPLTPETHEHAWYTESRHPTSDGTVLYVRCGECGSRRVDLQAHPHTPPVAVSGDLGRPRS
ncbi:MULTISPECIES: hypothetical protein [unclassified Microbacterium]|uniref:hypothetical protein n=1 Tax=unclassified Microbacterium TaxID=2609290 RepID=UPI0016055C52|nr:MULTISPECIES: hypothetical protein [unclassified Microbacterium]QNA93308.1 hypothetical protein G4G29_15045 [Microbacterium sp. Se63.02b]QYM63519.1 hypothetical protein K1X59_15090 [Microbacterium sp. Se5.02b]